ncbi:MAG: hypothetical protein MUE50_22170, partial [Pirellulaceae bacterium]|nr:hypothetical protein [Pirellulaceae bacterium]
YNLAIAGKKQPSAPASSGAVQAVAELLPRLFADKSRDKLAIPLKHQYTQAALAPGELKGADRACVDVLVRAAQRADYQAFLALMTHHQSGIPAFSSMDFGPYRSRRRSYRDYDYDDEEDPGSADDNSGAEFEEVFEESMSLDHWLDAQGRPQPFGTLKLKESEIVSDVAPEDRPYRQEIHEATGNEGASMDRWYHQAVVVIWPRDRYFGILAGEGPDHAVGAFEQLVSATKKPAADADCRAFAQAILERWNAAERTFRSRRSEDEISLSTRMLKLLDRIGSPDLAVRFVRDILPDHCTGSEGPALVRVVQRLGWADFADPLRQVFARQAPDQSDRKLTAPVAMFEALCCSPPKMTDERRAICAALADDLEQAFDRYDHPPRQAWWTSNDPRTGIVERVFRALAAIGDAARLERFVSRVLADPQRYGLHAVLVPAVKALPADVAEHPCAQAAWDRLRDHCLAELRARTATKPQPPADWAREATIDCRCADCRELVAFLKNPNEQVHRFPRRKDLRQHLHGKIDHHQCDLTHVTVRVGSPQTLVCTKTQASYERRLAQFNVDTQLLGELESLSGPEAATPKKGRRTKAKPS